MQSDSKSFDRVQKALELFFEGYNCSQAIAGAFADVMALSPEAAMRLVAGFGAGTGDHKGMCGALSSAIFVTGALHEPVGPADLAAKKQLYADVNALKAEFTEKFGTTNCGELLRSAKALPKPDPSERNAEYYSRRPCAHFVATVAQLLEKGAGDRGPRK
ncbi:MAG: C-GCAxxG-C-C family protein [Myxococcales bacterium]|jgi:C_GCAxxG_C_C family probable redox protein|nr:C-GCAxxG-C-C family protein [Myxococcales bacterium]